MSLRCGYRARQSFNITTMRVWECSIISTTIIRSTPVATDHLLSRDIDHKYFLTTSADDCFFVFFVVPCGFQCDRLSHSIVPYFTLNSRQDHCRDNWTLHSSFWTSHVSNGISSSALDSSVLIQNSVLIQLLSIVINRQSFFFFINEEVHWISWMRRNQLYFRETDGEFTICCVEQLWSLKVKDFPVLLAMDTICEHNNKHLFHFGRFIENLLSLVSYEVHLLQI